MEKSQKKEKKFSKKQKVIIRKGDKWINENTGEVIETTEIVKFVEQDFNFHKVWLTDLMRIIELTGNKALKVLNYILGQMDNANRIILTYREIAQETKVSLFTVVKTLKILKDADFIRKEKNGVYMVNPNILAKGTHSRRLNLLVRYIQIPNENKNKKDEENNIQKTKKMQVKEIRYSKEVA